ncbi:hypothetical protein AA0119_g8403 [Alternaria tenuissima]|uniref:Uncharacterized protein n=2 Tax=Alternaria alternata complex TaxID=187734 RepID=A0A4Q4NHH2_ALTAL|nr:hypothetical protein AA0115_g10647 [Alternaria tenuissima]RYN76855.1 hypothetical protein AA0117_g5384 [Alternaria alternata]RYN67547.1 hypothetical protein AA0118_g1418 [Alternaria tenuissima]RYN89671.1 hypothetical protein AA0120_g6196 [Alternaria tenuissima]RYN95696.1 hypothetical protein AA0119_g8403 [Alternaria tenuissima]
MRSLIFLTSLLYCRVSSAQSLSSMPLDALLTCQNGYALSLTCAEPLPVDDECTCTCRDGAVYNQTRPDLLGLVPTTPGTASGSQIVGTPCTEEIIQPWTKLVLPHKKYTLEPTEIVSGLVDIAEDSVFLVADSQQRCQHFEVYIDDQLAGETFGDGPLDNSWCGEVGEECMEKHGGSHGYFKLSKGNHSENESCYLNTG